MKIRQMKNKVFTNKEISFRYVHMNMYNQKQKWWKNILHDMKLANLLSFKTIGFQKVD